MKARDIIIGSENLGWCRPFISDRVKFTLAEGYISCLMIDGNTYTAPYGHNSVNNDILKKAAKITVEDYDLFNGWTDEDLLLTESICKECGCINCPWYDICDAMDEELEIER